MAGELSGYFWHLGTADAYFICFLRQVFYNRSGHKYSFTHFPVVGYRDVDPQQIQSKFRHINCAKPQTGRVRIRVLMNVYFKYINAHNLTLE